MKKLTVDRFEGIYALLEDSDEKIFAITTNEMPDGAKEGDIVVITDEGEIYIDAEATAARRKEMAKLQKKVTSRRKK
ncbi:MAG: DUF3006 domain-containing protein [Clostridia bacterium]|nr:DUF3006 domain-containing protein [Clostridia bacterium]